MLDRVERDWPNETEPQRVEREAMAIALRASSAFIERYARLAAEASAREKSPARRRELATIAEVCRRVAHAPARSLHNWRSCAPAPTPRHAPAAEIACR